jgi:uncharacterized protein
MEKQEIIKKTKRFAMKKLSEDKSGHDWWHTYRVWGMGKKIANIERADVFIVELICLLHDIADYKLNKGNETIGTEISKNWLKNLGLDEKIINLVTNAISKISFKGKNLENKSLSIEEKCAQDADRLDAIGAIGIARCFTFGGFNGNSIHNPNIIPRENISEEEYKKLNTTSINHFYEKLLILKDYINTETAKKIAEERHLVMLDFLEKFFKEWNFLQ